MKHPVFFLFFALITTSVINAIPRGFLSKRATQFYQCIYNGTDIPPLNVSVLPDPIVSGQDVTFGISGTATTDITEATVRIYLYDGHSFYRNYMGNLCELYKSCPVKKDTKFDFPFTTKPNGLPATYFIEVWISKNGTDFHCATTYNDLSPSKY
ncbi:1031_t:CDS:1 [Paraglomus occultum]|uniref:Phosphatidylglycerol/phosphatidylinositol transfer protein n=1 Tax=Paraglomus occultum TaxID=144539 RepID=A0A9N9C768_9GLOM|nr:1031_t:CDS:1 [Paraglomus occultum]